MSTVYVIDRELEKAISEAKKAIQKDPKKIEAYLHLANL
jgi:Tfp pilus assembly protein PilF